MVTRLDDQTVNHGTEARPALRQQGSSHVRRTLLREDNPLASAARQMAVLENPLGGHGGFAETLKSQGLAPLRAHRAGGPATQRRQNVQPDLRHCHVDAGPDRREAMSRETMEACLRLLEQSTIQTVDVTGGAPEMNPDFRWFVAAVRSLGRRVVDRCNLTILLAAGYTDLPEFLASHRVEIVASLPCYLEANTDQQRGDGVFARSIEALRRLNELGYGWPDTGLTLTLVYNPLGPQLPPRQNVLEADYRRELWDRYGISFSRLYTVTNMPISRFLDDLLRSGRYDEYQEMLIAAFNPQTVSGLMCRYTLSVDWQGNLFDCDFNQMLQLGLSPGCPRNIRELDASGLTELANRPIVTARHCFGCTAGSGSSCQGSLTTERSAGLSARTQNRLTNND